MRTTNRIQPGAIIYPRELISMKSEVIGIPTRNQTVHLQFRRFAGCPVCNLHLYSFVQRHEELEAASIKEVVVFHSTPEELAHQTGDLPFAVVADPGKQLYAAFGVESAPRALLDPRAWTSILRAVARSLYAVLFDRKPIPPINPRGGSLGLPADFLIASDGRVLACSYGAHVYDQWSVDELLGLATSQKTATQAVDPERTIRTSACSGELA